MIKYYKGTVFNTNAEVIVNAVNCVGVMGAGIALEFKLRYPNMYLEYDRLCLEKKLNVGKLHYYKNAKDQQIILNFPTKLHYNDPSELEYIEAGLIEFINTYKTYNFKSIAFPKLGAGLGGLIWFDVRELMEKYLSNLDIDIYICLDELDHTEGIEKKMLDCFNDFNLESLSNKSNYKSLKTLENKKPFTRFYKIGNFVNINLYKEIFTFFYEKVKK